MPTADLETLVAQAAAILDEASITFVDGHRAESLKDKGGNDFATAIDLELEDRLKEELTDVTGIPVHGEEYGGADLDAPLVWVIDPIDGTFNYSVGSPMAAILVALLRDGEPVAGLTWLPFVDQRYTGIAGGPLRCNGIDMSPLAGTAMNRSIVGMGTFNVDSRGRLPGRYRLAIFEELTRKMSKVRMHGSTGIDMAYVSAGILSAAISFGDHIWDHAAGVALVRAAGGVVTDLAGEPWTRHSRSSVAAAPGVHGHLMEIIAGVGSPEGYR